MLFENRNLSACGRELSFLLQVEPTEALNSRSDSKTVATKPIKPISETKDLRPWPSVVADWCVLKFQVKGMILAQSERWRRV